MLKGFDLNIEVFMPIIPVLGQSGDRSHLQEEGKIPKSMTLKMTSQFAMICSITGWIRGKKKM